MRLLNYALVPLHTHAFAQQQADYGVLSELYAWVSLLNILFMYGMETAFFRFAQSPGAQSPGAQPPGAQPSEFQSTEAASSAPAGTANSRAVFGTAFSSLLITTVLGVGFLIAGSASIADFLDLAGQGRFVIWFAAIIGLDTLANIPFAQLRLQNRAGTYVAIKLLNVLVNVGLNFFFLLPLANGNPEQFADWGFTYRPEIGVGYVFIANLAASGVTLIALLPLLLRLPFRVDGLLWKRMMAYGSPFIIAGLAGMVNETLDRILLVRWLPGDTLSNRAQVGVYSAAYKLSIFMTLAVQAFRLGAEPFFFRMASAQHARQVYALVMRGFVLVAAALYLAVTVSLGPLQHILGSSYREAVGVVPILLMANLFLGIYYNLSIWYKLTDRTRMAIWLALAGALITLLGNAWGIPRYGYWASAWTTLGAYGLMAVLSAWGSRRYYPVPYPYFRLGGILAFAALLGFLFLQVEGHWPGEYGSAGLWLLRFAALGLYTGLAWWIEGRHFLRDLRGTG